MHFARLGFILGLLTTRLAASVPLYEEPAPFNSYLYGGYREDRLKFHIGGDGHGHTNKKFSKVQFKELRMAHIGGSVNYSTLHHYYLRASADYGRILQGEGIVRNEIKSPFQKGNNHHKDNHNNDDNNGSDNNNDNNLDCPDDNDRHKHKRNREISKQRADANDGFVYDVSGAVGWKVVSAGGRAWIAGFIGYSFERQSLHMRNFRQTKDTLNLINPVALRGVKASYRTRWAGPFVGVDFVGRVECDVQFFGMTELHIADFRAEGIWERHPAFKAKIKHHSRGYGLVANLGFDWAPFSRWGFGAIVNFQQWSTRPKGTNRSRTHSLLFPSSNLPKSFPLARKSRLFRVTWISWGISFVTTYRF